MSIAQGQLVFGNEVRSDSTQKGTGAVSCTTATNAPLPETTKAKDPTVLDLSEAGADLLFVTNFWVCDCGTTYRKREIQECPYCGRAHDECPDALADELIEYSRHLLTNQEYREITRELESMRQRLATRQHRCC